MSTPNLSAISEQLSGSAFVSNNTLNGYSFDPHFRGKVREIRGMGYTPITAILEFTDNSVRLKCGSTRVVVKLHRTYDPPYYLDRISVLDNGCGMTYQELCNSFIFNVVKERDDGDIGKFHVGGKYAAIALGDELMIISKRKGGDIVGLYADVRQMQVKNSFAPTEVCLNVTDEWALRKIPPTLWEQFKSNESGTLIHIPTLVANVRTDFGRYVEEFKRCLSTSYTGLYNNCVVVLEEQEKVISEIQPIDLFYQDSPECLDEVPYETELYIYNAGLGIPSRVIEKNTTTRKLPSKKLRCGTPARPQYFEYRAPDKDKKGRGSVMFPIDASSIPDEKDLIDTQLIRIIQVNEVEFKKEKAYFPENSRLAGDRKGFWFNREIRNVGAAKQLNKKLGDRTSMAGERQRCLVTFSDKSDEQVGSKFNKQMDDNALPCAPLDAALKELYKQVTLPWVNKWKPRERTVRNEEEEYEEESEEEVNDEQLVYEEVENESNDVISAMFRAANSSNSNAAPVVSEKEEEEEEEEGKEEEGKEEEESSTTTTEIAPTTEIESQVDVLDTTEVESVPTPVVPTSPTDPTSSLTYNSATNTLLFRTITNDEFTIKSPGNGQHLYEWLKSITDTNMMDEIVEMLSNRF